MEHILARFKPETDLYVLSNLSMDTLDYAGPAVNEGSKGVMLGVGKPVRELLRAYKGEPPIGVRDVRPYCGGCLVVEGVPYSDEPDQAARLADAFPGWPLVVLVDDAAATVRTDPRFIWTAFTRFEPAADLHGKRRIHRNHLVFEGSIVLDARMKPTYPKELFCDSATAKTVDERWAEYFPGGKVAMGDSGAGHLG
jgi:3-polyprenyl-4-hydroxybenzoate decarboxylase